MGNIKDLTGKVFGQRIVIGYAGLSKWGSALWCVQCTCGRISFVAGIALRQEKQIQCRHCASKKSNFIHGLVETPTYSSWHNMMKRCYNVKNPSYFYYGSRGIKVCKRWQKFENFFVDMGKRPENMSIDRINNDGNYEPKNCRWATHSEQQKNKRI